MRRTAGTLTRGWLALATAVVAALPAATPALAVTPTTPATRPHAVGGYLPGSVLTSAKTTLGDVSAFEVPPASVDLRGYAPPVGDQGQIGSCVAWTIGYSIMGYYAKRTGGAGAPYAPLFLYLRNVAKGGAPDAGLNPDAVLTNAQAAGVDTQADYWQGTTNWQSPPTQAEIDNARNYRVAGWSRLFVGDDQGTAAQTLIKQTLASGSPVALAIPVYEDFMYLGAHSLYNTSTGKSLGGHMITAYGYDAQGVFIRNSWGTYWGNGGDAKLSWAFITKAATGAYAVNGIATPAAPSPTAPTVGALSTARATAGTAVTVSGTGLSTATAVRFGTDLASFTPRTVAGRTELVAVAPAHAAGVVDVTVTNPSGTSPTGTASRFTYLPAPPSVTSLVPSSVSVVGGTPVTLFGARLTGVTAVKVGTTSVPAKAVASISLTFVAPPRAAGAVAVTVTNASGTSAQAALLTYVAPPAPVVTSITPNTGPANKATPVSATELRLTLPARPAGKPTVQITTPGGVSRLGTAATFTYLAPPRPVIGRLSVSKAATKTTTPLTITGRGLTGATRVTVGGVATSFTRVSDTRIRITVPARTKAGRAAIAVTTPGGTSAAASFSYVAVSVKARAHTAR
jgi:hypothetical protein